MTKAPYIAPREAETAMHRRQGTGSPAAPAVKRPARAVLFALLCALLFRWYPGFANEPARQSLTSIQKAAEHFVRERVHSREQKITVEAGSLDRRLSLHPCGDELDAFLPHGYQVRSNTTVGIRCHSPKPWKIYVPVRVTALGKVIVSARALDHGATLSAGDVETQEREIHLLSVTYFMDPRDVEGKQLRRRVPKGELITAAMLKTPKLISRGQRVTLVAGHGPVQIRMSGQALEDGTANQRIRVENLSSGRAVEGLVRSSEIVEILLD